MCWMIALSQTIILCCAKMMFHSLIILVKALSLDARKHAVMLNCLTANKYHHPLILRIKTKLNFCGNPLLFAVYGSFSGDKKGTQFQTDAHFLVVKSSK